jgi:hypothetical protein
MRWGLGFKAGERVAGPSEMPTQMSKQNEQKERKNTHSQTSRLETPEELQLHHNHKNSCF